MQPLEGKTADARSRSTCPAGPLHAANTNDRVLPVTIRSTFPPDAVARIYRPARSAMTSGKARTKKWMLCFEQRTKPFIEPLMGWTGSDDPLTQIELTFPTRAVATAYAERQGLTYVVEGHDADRAMADRCREDDGHDQAQAGVAHFQCAPSTTRAGQDHMPNEVLEFVTLYPQSGRSQASGCVEYLPAPRQKKAKPV